MKIDFRDKKTLIIFIVFDTIITLIFLAFIFKEFIFNEKELPNVSENNFKIEKVLNISCKEDIECETPYEYLLMSRCPFTSKCIDNKCSVICPNF
jgi:regulatory protein YycI of two-component signal transduction system YycFG